MTQDLMTLAQERIEVLVPKDEDISPEALEIANSYLRNSGSPDRVASELGLPLAMVAKELGRKEVRRYVDTIFMDMGYRNRFKLNAVLDSIIDQKLEEMKEAEISSGEDISKLLELAHKMRMDELELQLKFEKLNQTRDLAMIKERSKVVNTGPVINIQDNSQYGSNYGALLAQLLEKK